MARSGGLGESAELVASQPRTARGRHRNWLASVLCVTVAIAGTGPWAAAADPERPRFARPLEADLAADAGTVVADDLPTLPDAPLDLTPALLALADQIDAMPLEASDIGALAATFGTDLDAAFAFVRDEVRVEPYPGVLRGAHGALAARAGNALDRAMLLHDLLVTMGFSARYAFADLGAESVTAVLKRAMADAGTGRPAAGTARDVGPIDLDAVTARARRDHALLLDALGDRTTSLGDAASRAAAHEQIGRDAGRHAWVQVERDGEWVDLDPTLATALPGAALATAGSTADEMPPELVQGVTVRIVAEVLTDGYLEEIVALERRLESALASSSQILLLFTPGGGGGGGLLGGTEAVSSYSPVLLVDGAADVGAELPVPPQDGGGFSDLGGFGGGGASELISLRLEVVRDAPGREPASNSRTLLDRVPPDVRASGAIAAEQLEPFVLADGVPVALVALHHLMISDGGADPRAAAIDRLSANHFAVTELADGAPPEGAGGDLLLWPMTALDETLPLASERLVVDSLGGGGLLAFIARPRVYLVTLGPATASPQDLGLTYDLLADDLATLAAPGIDPRAEAGLRLWYGVVQSALETEMARSAAVASTDPGRTLEAASLGGDAPLTVLDPTAGTSGPAGSSELGAALARGLMVVVPGDPATARTWWTIAPQDGATRNVLDPALGGAYVFFGAGPNYLRVPGMAVEIQRSYMIEADDAGGVEYQLVTDLVAVASIGAASAVGAYIKVVAVGLAVGIALTLYLTL